MMRLGGLPDGPSAANFAQIRTAEDHDPSAHRRANQAQGQLAAIIVCVLSSELTRRCLVLACLRDD